MSHLRVVKADGVFRDTTVTPLGAAGVFTGTAEDMTYWSYIGVVVNSDQAGSVIFEAALSAGGPWAGSLSFTFPGGGQARAYNIGSVAPFMRVRYVNGATPQASFLFITRFSTVGTKWSSAPLNTAVTGDDDAELVKAVITGPDPAGDFQNIGVEQYVDGQHHLRVDVTQNIYADPNNSSTTNLDGGNGFTFTGVATETFGVGALQANLFADKRCLLHVQQSIDGTNWDIDDVFNVEPNAGFGITVQATAAFWRVVVTTNAETTTTFRLQGVLTPVMEALPRTLDFNGNLKVALQGDPQGNGPASFTPLQELLTVKRTRLNGQQFDGNTLDTQFWATSVSGTGTVTQSGTEVLLSTGGTAAGAAARLWSTRRARKNAGAVNRFNALFQAGSAGIANVRRRVGVAWGAAMPTITDGAWFEVNDTTLRLVTRKGGVDTFYNNGTFNGEHGYSFDVGTPTLSHAYDIVLDVLGFAFLVDQKLLHRIPVSTATLCNTQNFYAYQDIENTGIAASTQTDANRVMAISRLGDLLAQPHHYFHAAATTAGIQLKLGPGTCQFIDINSVANNANITLYDGTSAVNPIWTTGSMGASTAPFTIPLTGIQFDIGLFLVVATAAAGCTVVYE